MKLLNATFDIENDLEEYRLRNHLDSINAKYMRTIPNTEHLKGDKHFLKLQKDVKTAKDNLYKYINNNRI